MIAVDYFSQSVKVSDALLLDARMAGEAVERSIRSRSQHRLKRRPVAVNSGNDVDFHIS